MTAITEERSIALITHFVEVDCDISDVLSVVYCFLHSCFHIQQCPTEIVFICLIIAYLHNVYININLIPPSPLQHTCTLTSYATDLQSHNSYRFVKAFMMDVVRDQICLQIWIQHIVKYFCLTSF